MKTVRIKAIRQSDYTDLQQIYEMPQVHACSVSVGQEWLSVDAQQPEGLCDSAWQTLQPFVEQLANGGGNFFDGWMRNPYSAMLSCNDGFRPVSFLIETI